MELEETTWKHMAQVLQFCSLKRSSRMRRTMTQGNHCVIGETGTYAEERSGFDIGFRVFPQEFSAISLLEGKSEHSSEEAKIGSQR